MILFSLMTYPGIKDLLKQLQYLVDKKNIEIVWRILI